MNKVIISYHSGSFIYRKTGRLRGCFIHKTSLLPAFLLFAMFLFGPVNAQEGFVKYRQILNLDPTTFLKDTLGVPAFLYFKDSCSLYVFNRSGDMPESRSLPDQFNEGATEIAYAVNDRYGNMFFKDFSASRLLIRQLIWGKAYRTEEPLPSIQWTITPETRQIGKFNCHKALTRFRGRDYEAWFCPDVPVKDGPWKFQGLPGLIMDIYDSKREIRIFIETIHIPASVGESLKIPQDGKYVPFKLLGYIEQNETGKIVRFLQSIPEKGSDAQVVFSYHPIEKEDE